MSRLGNLGGRLYRGEVSIDFVGKQKFWYLVSGFILIVSIISLATLGLNRGIEFKGGSVFQFKASSASTAEVRSTVKDSGVHIGEPIVQSTSAGWRVQTESLDSGEVAKVQQTVAQKYGLKSSDDVAVQTVGASWGADVSKKALQGLVIFVLLVMVYLWVTFEAKMALAAIIALAHDILITVGVYSLVQFEVTPGSVVGLLTILGYSLYDTVVVFDKVRENTRGLGSGTGPMRTYSQAANLAVNQTLVRSINTSLIALLPVAGLLFIGAGLLQAGTLKDLSLVLFVGMLAGTYSSICIATPLLADFKEREPKMKELRERLAARQSSAKRQARSEKSGRQGQSLRADGAEHGGTLTEVFEDDEASPAGDTATPRKVVQRGPRQQPVRGTRRSRGGQK
ncbi:MAG TPA: protein translocase subunit SecF [Actinomadura sp.]|jgi:preprotein translocase subunit SecF|nr:protein translocase subunit SecF [Actinomadura sp.]